MEALPESGDATIQTLELLWRAAPEQVEELDQLFAAGVQARVSRGWSPELGVNFNVLQIPGEVLEQLWLLSHAAWHDLVEFDKLKADPNASVETALALEAEQAAKNIANGNTPCWPAKIPVFNEAREGDQAKAIRELFAMAAAWAILHEMQHAKFYDDPNRPDDRVAEEMQCDAYAADFLFAKVDKYSELTGEAADRVRGKRAMATLVGLYYVARVSRESKVGGTHPPLRDRIRLLFDKIGTESAAHFWGFATALMWGLKHEIAFMTVTIPNPSSRDLAYYALDKAFE